MVYGVAARPEAHPLPVLRVRGQRLAAAGRLGLIFLPAFSLSLSQFGTLEPPDADENPITVSIDATVEAIAEDIVGQLGLGPAGGGRPSGNRP